MFFTFQLLYVLELQVQRVLHDSDKSTVPSFAKNYLNVVAYICEQESSEGIKIMS